MGSGIAQTALASGYAVVLCDVSYSALERARDQMKAELTRRWEKGDFPNTSVEHFISKLHTTTSLSDLSHCDLVIEAAIEDLGVKQDIFRALGATCSEECILASNTSSLSITEIASSSSVPGRVVGLHFFNPPSRMQLVEIVKGFHTSEETLLSCESFIASLGRTPIAVKDTPGFIVNRVARPFYGEALRLLGEDVAAVDTIDRIVKLEGGFKMGPFELMDLIGIDVNFSVTQSIYEQTFHEPRYRPHPIQRMMVNAGQLGKKSGKGFYKYKP